MSSDATCTVVLGDDQPARATYRHVREKLSHSIFVEDRHSFRLARLSSGHAGIRERRGFSRQILPLPNFTATTSVERIFSFGCFSWWKMVH